MKNKQDLAFQVLAISVITVFVIFCLMPFLLLISASVTPEQLIYKNGYQFFPDSISFEAYKVLFKAPESILRAYVVTISVTVIGTLLSLYLTSMAAYVLYRRDFKYRNFFALYFYFTMLFSGGLIPFYILIVRYLELKDSILALILPALLSAWYIILMRSFMATVHIAIIESAKIDGAGDYQVFNKIVLPLLKPALATIGLFTALGYWNDWFNALLYIDNKNLIPLQYFLYKMLNNYNFAQGALSTTYIKLPELPTQSLKMATAVVATGPIVFLYPFLQKYFVKGLMLGSIKG